MKETSAAASGRVLVVEDERDLAAMVAAYLERGGFAVDLVSTGTEAVERVRELEPDVVLLDLGLPGLDGIEVCRRIRTFSDSYVLMVTARTDEVDTLVGLSVGADDYIAKPFRPRELVARVQAVLRRPRTASDIAAPGAQRLGDLELDVPGRRVTVAGRPVELTRTEFDILALLASEPRVAFSRRRIIESVWDSAWVGAEHVVDVHVAAIRAKTGDDPAHPRYIETVRGVGYRMVQP